MITTYTATDLRGAYEEMSGSLHCECRLTTELVGGQPAGQEGVRRFVEHHLHIADPDQQQEAIDRILHTEMGQREITPEGGELKESESYGVNVIRSSEKGPWLGNWMIKANIKAAASRTGLFQSKRGTKGNFSEGGEAIAVGLSLLELEQPGHIYLIDAQSEHGAKTYFSRFQGKVSTPQGSNSIQHDSECVAPGTRFEFTFRFLPKSVTEEDLVKVMSLAQVIGLGSVKALERGRFTIDKMEVNLP